MTKYVFIENGKINGKGECPIISDGWVSFKVSDEVYNDDLLKYVWNGKKLIPNPNYDEEEKARYNEEMRQERLNAYVGRTDGLVSRKIRKQAIGEWTDDEENEFKQQMKTISEEISKEFAYKE